MVSLPQIQSTLKKHLKPSDNVVVAVSGGPDSMCLLYLCLKIIPKQNIIVAHLDHGIRKESRLDKQLVEKYCRKNGLLFESATYNIPLIAKKTKRSLEEAGRMKRYEFLRAVKEKYMARYILVAHHRDDNVETMLLHLVRGASLRGLSGMQVVSKDVLRPLLPFSKEELLAFCKKNKIPYRLDATNLLSNTSRNLLRLEIIPRLKKINHQLEQTLMYTQIQLQEVAEYLSRQAEKFLAGQDVFSQQRFSALPLVIQRVILQKIYEQVYLSTEGLSFSELEKVRLFILQRGTGKKISFGKKLFLKNEYGTIHLSHAQEKLPNKKIALKIPGQTSFGFYTVTSQLLDQVPAKGFYLELPASQLFLRHWQTGDRFKPLGMRGQKKLQDFFSDLKIPSDQRRDVPLLVDEKDRVLAVYNWRIDDRVRTTPKTKKILLLEFKT